MRSIRLSAGIGAVVGTLALAPHAHAQVGASVEAFAGYYRPTGHFDPASVYDVDLPLKPSDLAGAAVGATAHLSIGERYGVAAQFAVAKSQLGKVFTPAGPRGPVDQNVSLAMLLAQYDVSPRPDLLRLWLNAGAAAIRYGGDAYRRYGSPVSFGPAIGTTMSVPLVMHLALTANVSEIFYRFNLPLPSNLALNPGPLQHGAQRDVLLHLGLDWTRP